MVISRTKLQEVIAGYKKYFPSHISDEIYKWKAVKHFQDVWDIDAPDFIAMFWEATSTFDNLLTSMNHSLRGMAFSMTSQGEGQEQEDRKKPSIRLRHSG